MTIERLCPFKPPCNLRLLQELKNTFAKDPNHPRDIKANFMRSVIDYLLNNPDMIEVYTSRPDGRWKLDPKGNIINYAIE